MITRPAEITRPPSVCRPSPLVFAPPPKVRRRSRMVGTSLCPTLAAAFALYVQRTTPFLNMSAALRQVIRRQVIMHPDEWEAPSWNEREKSLLAHVTESIDRAAAERQKARAA